MAVDTVPMTDTMTIQKSGHSTKQKRTSVRQDRPSRDLSTASVEATEPIHRPTRRRQLIAMHPAKVVAIHLTMILIIGSAGWIECAFILLYFFYLLSVYFFLDVRGNTLVNTLMKIRQNAHNEVISNYYYFTCMYCWI